MQEWGDLCSHSTRLTGMLYPGSGENSIVRPEGRDLVVESPSFYAHYHWPVGQTNACFTRSSKVGSLSALGWWCELGVTSHRCVRTIARSTDSSTEQFVWQVYAGDYCLPHSGDIPIFEGRYKCACAQ